MDLLANENFPFLSIKLPRNTGYNVASVIEETPGSKDINISKRARRENRVTLIFWFVDCGISILVFSLSTKDLISNR